MLDFSKSVPIKKQTHVTLHLGWPEGEYISTVLDYLLWQTVTLYLHIRVLKATTPSRPCRKMPKESMKSPFEQRLLLGSAGEELEDADGSWLRDSTLTPTPAIAQHFECFKKARKYQFREVEMIDRAMTQLWYITKALLWASSHGYWSADVSCFILDLDASPSSRELPNVCQQVVLYKHILQHWVNMLQTQMCNGSLRLMLSILQHTLSWRHLSLYYGTARAVSC